MPTRLVTNQMGWRGQPIQAPRGDKVIRIGFIDTTRYFPLDPDLFVDAVHTTWAGLRLQAWVAFNQLRPTVQKHLADGSWPRPSDPATAQLPTIVPRKITFDCRL